MPTVDVVDLKRQKVGSVDLPEEVFGCKLHTALVHEAVVMQRACERQGTASTLRRGEVAGSGKKPWKQKHTGRARAGSIRSPVWRHGGSVFGPKPRDYSYSMPKKKYRAALQSALVGKVSRWTSGDSVESVVGAAQDEIVGSSADSIWCRGICLDRGRRRACWIGSSCRKPS